MSTYFQKRVNALKESYEELINKKNMPLDL